MKLDSSRSFQSMAETGDKDEENLKVTEEQETYETEFDYSYLAEGEENVSWSSDLSSVPLEKEIVVAWNFTNSMCTKSVAMRDSANLEILWLDALTGSGVKSKGHYIKLSDAKYWLALPELPAE